MSFLFNKGKELMSSKVALYQDKLQDNVAAIQENINNIQPLDSIKSQANDLTHGIGEKYNSAVDGLRKGVDYDAVLSGRDQLSMLSGGGETLQESNDDISTTLKTDTQKTKQIDGNNSQVYGMNVSVSNNKRAVKNVSVARAVSDIRHNVSRDAIVRRGHKLRQSQIQSSTGQVGARVIINGGPTVDARDTSTPNFESQTGFRPVSKPVRSFSEADDRAFQILGNNLNPKNLRQTRTGIVIADGSVQGPHNRAMGQVKNAEMQYMSGAEKGLQQVLVGSNIGAPTEKFSHLQDTAKSSYNLKNQLNRDSLIKRGQSFKANYIDPGLSQVGNKFSGIFTIPNQTNNTVDVATPQSKTVGKANGAIPGDTTDHVNGIILGSPYHEKVTAAGNAIRSGYDMRNKFTKDNLIQQGQSLKATHIDPGTAQIGNKFSGIFGFSNQAQSNVDATENPDGNAQTSVPTAMNPLQTLKNKQNKAFEDIEAGKEKFRQKGLGILEAKTGFTGGTLQEGKELLSGLGIFGDGSKSGKENKEKKSDEMKGGKENIATNGQQKLTGLMSLNKKEDTEKKDKNENDLFGKATDIGKGLFTANLSDTRGPSCTYTSGVIVRLALIVVNALTIVRTVHVTNNHWNWGCAPLCSIFLALEYAMVVFRRLGREWSWWLPCVLVYLVTTLPLIWQLQLENAGMEDGVVKKTDVWTIIASDAIVYLTIFARWMLQGGTVTIMTLATVLLEFLANASDIMDLLSLTDQPEVRSNINLMYWVLGAWSVAFLKFIPLIDDDAQGNGKPKTLPVCIQKSFGPDFTKLLEMLFSLVLLNGSFLAVRLYLLAVENVVTFSLVFFLVKNVLAFCLEIYNIVALCRGLPCTKKK